MTTLIKNAMLVDGTGAPARRSDVYIRGSRIAEVGPDLNAAADIVIDAAGKTLTPGFVDAHSHSDGNVLCQARNEVALFQGVTTTISGQCGLAAAPLCDAYAYWANSMDLAQFYGEPRERFENLEHLYQCLEQRYGLHPDLGSMAGFIRSAEQQGMSFNIAQLAGHNNLRGAVMGADCRRQATAEEISAMCRLLEQQLDQGCIGMSSGLDYDSGRYSDLDELTALASVLKARDCIYTTHVRIVQAEASGFPFKGELLGILEAIEIARRTGVRLHISHVLPYNYHLSAEPAYVKKHDAIVIKKVLDNAVQEGIALTYDVMTGETGGTDSSYLIALFEEFVRQEGSEAAFLSRLSDGDYARSICEKILTGQSPRLSIMWEPTIDEWIVIARCKAAQFAGKTIRQISLEMGTDYVAAMLELLRRDPDTRIYYRIGCVYDEFLQEICRARNCFPSCDGYSFDAGKTFGDGGRLDIGPSWLCYNFAIRFLKEYCSDPFEEAVRRMTSAPLMAHGIRDRGLVREGFYADLVLLDQEKLCVNQDITGEKRSPLGIEKVFVNGVLTVDNGVHLGARAGMFCQRR